MIHGDLDGSGAREIVDEDAALSVMENLHAILKSVVDITAGSRADGSLPGATYDDEDVILSSCVQITAKVAQFRPLRQER